MLESALRACRSSRSLPSLTGIHAECQCTATTSSSQPALRAMLKILCNRLTWAVLEFHAGAASDGNSVHRRFANNSRILNFAKPVGWKPDGYRRNSSYGLRS